MGGADRSRRAARQSAWRALAVYHLLIQRISSAEQFKNVQSLDNVEREGCILPDRYCEMVGFDTPIALAISVFVFPEVSISYFRLRLIC